MLLGATSFVSNETIQHGGCCSVNAAIQPYYRTRNCDRGLTSNTPASQYQRQKIIQNTVRVASSLYTMNVGSLSSYESANTQKDHVPWNQMSDRKKEHVQNVVTASGSTYGGNSSKRSLLRMRPGAMSPGGAGVDIKHNSYERRLNRLKGRAVLRRGPIPPTFGQPIVFNRAFPVYGGKTVQTSIVEDCQCPVDTFTEVEPSALPNDIYSVKYQYSVGQEVYSIETGTGNPNFQKATIVGIIIDHGLYDVLFDDQIIQQKGPLEILPYFACDCNASYENSNNPFNAIVNALKYETNSCCKNLVIQNQIQTIINNIIA